MNPHLIRNRYNIVDYTHQPTRGISIVILLYIIKAFGGEEILNLLTNQKRLTVQPQFLLEWTKSLANCGR